MAFQLVQKFKFDKVEHSYDPRGDVLDISFGPPVRGIALQVEDWLAIRVGLEPPFLQGMTIVGFKKVFERINRYAERELPDRMKRLANVRIKISISYDDESDTVVYRWEQERSAFDGLLDKLSFHKMGKPSIFEPLLRPGKFPPPLMAADQSLRNVYVEKSLPSKDILGIKIVEFTKCGPSALEGIFGAIIDTIFEPNPEYDENVHLITNAVVQRLDWQKFATLGA